MEQARKSFKELEASQTVQLLQHSSQRQRLLEDKLEEGLIKAMGFGKGCMYQDGNSRIMFKTFL